jgi:hypothetical protein
MALATIPHVTVRWRYLEEADERLNAWQCLYALVTPQGREVVYIEKAWRATVAERLRCRAKDAMWEHLSSCGIQECKVLLGEVMLQRNRRLTEQLLTDVESLSIMAEQPIGNIQSMSSRISRRGLRLGCAGKWPVRAKHYVDCGLSPCE